MRAGLAGLRRCKTGQARPHCLRFTPSPIPARPRNLGQALKKIRYGGFSFKRYTASRKQDALPKTVRAPVQVAQHRMKR